MLRLTERLKRGSGSLSTGANATDSGLFLEADRRRFWAKVDRRVAAGCWPWLASLLGNDGYGQFTVTTPGGASRKQLHLYAHRVAWIVTHGSIPQGLSVLHRCDTPGCCNPAHLFLGDHTDNMRDAARKGRLSVPRPGRHKISTAQLPEIDALLASGVKQAEIARQYGVTKSWICSYAAGARRQYDRQTQPNSKRGVA